jgi:tripartite-type tricarboxylate transporter receptor subunit TctC
MRQSVAITAAAVLLAAVAGHAPPAAAQFYKDKTVTFTVGFSVNNGYDLYSRMVARYIGKYLPGNPVVVVRNMPGAGSISAINSLYNVAPKDGTVLGMIDQAATLSQLFGEKGLQADVAKFNWIGRVTDNAAVLYGWHTAPVQHIRDAFEKELIISASGQNSRMLSTLMKNLLGMKLKILTGYRGAGESQLAMERGEIHALTQPYSVLRAEKADWIREKTITMLLQVGVDPYPDLAGVPLVTDLGRTEEEKRLIFLMAGNSRIGRSIVSPPGQPKERVEELRAAFMQTMADPQFLAEVRRLDLDVNPLSGAELQKVIENSLDASPEMVEKVKTLSESGG